MVICEAKVVALVALCFLILGTRSTELDLTTSASKSSRRNNLILKFCPEVNGIAGGGGAYEDSPTGLGCKEYEMDEPGAEKLSEYMSSAVQGHFLPALKKDFYERQLKKQQMRQGGELKLCGLLFIPLFPPVFN